MFSQLGRLLNALYLWTMKETPRTIAVTSSLNRISKGQLGNRVVVRGGGVTPLAPTLLQQICKDEVNGFSSTSDISFVLRTYVPIKCGT